MKTLFISDEVSKSKRKKLDGLYKKTEELPCYLIGQLGKNDLYKDDIDGHTIINYAVNIIKKSHEILSATSNRIYSNFKIDYRRNTSNRLSGKIESIERKIGDVNQ